MIAKKMQKDENNAKTPRLFRESIGLRRIGGKELFSPLTSLTNVQDRLHLKERKLLGIYFAFHSVCTLFD